MKLSSVSAYLELARWQNALMAAAGVVIGSRWVMDDMGWGGRTHLAAAAATAMALTVTANAWNDAADVDIDFVAHPQRPIPSGRITIAAARRTAVAAAVIALACAGLVSWALVATTVVVVLVMFAYSPWLKRAGLIGNITAAILASLPFLYGSWADFPWVDGLKAGGWLFGWAFTLHFARELAKDIDDMAGDAGHRRTFPLRWGLVPARLLVVAALACFVTPLLDWWDRHLLVAMIPAVAVVALGGVRVVRGTRGAPQALKAAMFLAVLALIAVWVVPFLEYL